MKDAINELSGLFKTFPSLERIEILRGDVVSVTKKGVTKTFESSVEMLEFLEQ